MTRPLEIAWRSVLVILLLTLSLFLNMPWVTAHLSLSLREQEHSRVEPAYSQSGFQIARGEVETTSRLAQAFQSQKIPGSWLLSFYGPSLLAGIVLSLYMRSGRIVTFGLWFLVGLALVLLALQWISGLPIAGQVEDFNRACRGNPQFTDPAGVFASPPEMHLTVGSMPFYTVVVLVIVGLTASLGLRRPVVENAPHESPGQSTTTVSLSASAGVGVGTSPQPGPAPGSEGSAAALDPQRPAAGQRDGGPVSGGRHVDERVVEHPPLSGGHS